MAKRIKRKYHKKYKKVTRIVDGKEVKMYLHRWVWIQANGEIPDGYDVHHKDGNIHNNELENLELIEIKKHKAIHRAKHAAAKTKKIASIEPDETPTPTTDDKKHRAPGGGRKPNRSTLFKKAMQKLDGKFPEIMEAMTAIALGQEVQMECAECGALFDQFKCPECGKPIVHKCLSKADKDLLIHLDNRLQGKPVAKTEIDMNAKMELTQAQLAVQFQQVIVFQQQLEKIDVKALENELAAVPILVLPEITQTARDKLPTNPDEKKEEVKNEVI